MPLSGLALKWKPAEPVFIHLLTRITTMVTDPIRQFQAAVHLLPQKLSSLSRHCKGSVVQISAQVAQGIADATPVIWREIGDVVGHLFKLSLTAGHGSGVLRVASASRSAACAALLIPPHADHVHPAPPGKRAADRCG